MKAPYSFDHMAEREFRRVRQASTKESRAVLRKRLLDSKQKKLDSRFGVNSIAITQNENSADTYNFVLSVGNFLSMASAKRFMLEQGISANSVHRAVNDQGESIFRVELGLFETEIEANTYGFANFAAIGYRVKPKVAEEYVREGWRIQFIAANDLENAKLLAESIETVSELFVVTKDVNGELLYCVVSRTFFEQSEAAFLLEELKIDGFLANTNNYLDVVWSK